MTRCRISLEELYGDETWRMVRCTSHHESSQKVPSVSFAWRKTIQRPPLLARLPSVPVSDGEHQGAEENHRRAEELAHGDWPRNKT